VEEGCRAPVAVAATWLDVLARTAALFDGVDPRGQRLQHAQLTTIPASLDIVDAGSGSIES
jgi:hypothetical protein